MTGRRVERRLAAILAADVAGYSRLMGLDEEGTLAVLTALWPSRSISRIAVHRGRVVTTTGEGKPVGFAGVLDWRSCSTGQALSIPDFRMISIFGRHFVSSETRVEIGKLLVRRDLGLSGRYVLLDDGRLPGGVLGIRVYADSEEQVECNQSRFWGRRYPYTVAENDSKAVHLTLPVFCHPQRVARLVRSIRLRAPGCASRLDTIASPVLPLYGGLFSSLRKSHFGP